MDPARRRLLVPIALYSAVTLVFLLTTATERLASHTPYNHFALLADAWLHGRLDLGGPPPAYTGNNDFAVFEGRYFVSFPPFPALLIAPWVKLSGGADKVRDARVFLWFAGIAPAMLHLALDKLSRLGRSRLGALENAGLALLFAVGTVYWFSAVQGTVWFVAHVVGAALATIYLYCSIDAEHPLLAGLALALGFATRTPLGFAFAFFVFEAYRVAGHTDAPAETALAPRLGRADLRTLAACLTRFGLPIALVLALLAWHNHARFGDAMEFGHRYLAIGWRGRIDHWGLFSYHYLGRNLGIVLTGLPFGHTADAPFQINVHGLALWITSPFYAWAVWPKRMTGLIAALALTASMVAAPSLLYQNSGWIQFGYRFSNDFAPFLMILIAVGGRRLGARFWALGAVAIVINGFGALTFQRHGFERYYFVDRTQRILHQPD